MLANRSLVLHQLGQHRAALHDIKRSLESGYPQSSVYKLYSRQASCFASLGQQEVAAHCLERARAAADLLVGEEREKALSYIREKSVVSQTVAGREHDVSVKLFYHQISPLVMSQVRNVQCRVAQSNPLYPSLSSKVRVVSSPDKGRHLLAAETISAGEILAVDTGAVGILSPDRSSSNCVECLASTLTPLHCPTCSTVVFCSSQCRATALASHHSYECSLALSDLNRLQLERSHHQQSCSSILLILRFFTQKTQQFFRNNRAEFSRALDGTGELREPQEEEPYLSSDYQRLVELVCHRKIDLLGEVWQITLALFILHCLSYCGWLDHRLDQVKDLTEEDVYLALLAVHMRGVPSYNTHQVGERLSRTGSLLQTQEVGVAVRPTVALINHSCWPNTVRCSAGREGVMMATRTIKAGQEVTDIYTESFCEASRVARQEKCAEYRFDCRCEACSQHWPLLSSLSSSLQDTPPSALSPNIPRHLLNTLAREISQLQDQANNHWNQGNIEQSLGKF